MANYMSRHTGAQIDQAVAAVLAGNVGGVTSVNGKSGAVTLAAGDIKRQDGTTVEDALGNLSEEIGALKNGNSTSITKTGTLISVADNSDNKIKVTSQIPTIALVQQGKNFAPSGFDFNNLRTKTEFGATMTTNEDGSIAVTGTPTAILSYWIMHSAFNSARKVPAGTYTASVKHVGTSSAWVGFEITAKYDDGTTAVNKITASPGNNRTFTLDAPATLQGAIITHATGSTYDNCVITVQLEIGTVATDHERFKIVEHNQSVPITVTAFEGTNVFYTQDAQPINVQYNVLGEDDEDEEPKFDPAIYSLPILYLYGDTTGMSKDKDVTLSYVYGDRSDSLTCKWQGNSSLSFPKKNYTLKFDNAFEAAEGWGEQKKYCAKANYNDFTQSRNVVSAKIWGEIVKKRKPANETLAACPNYGAIDGFPIAIVINDEFYGVYCFNVPKDEWMMNMGSGTNECIICADMHVPATKFEAGNALLDGSDFKIEYITDEDDVSWAVTSINNLLSACANSDGTDLDTTIATMLDWDSAIDYYIYTVLLRHTDGISKNYLLSTYDGVKWFFTAYDMDTVFGNSWNGAAYASPDSDPYGFRQSAAENHLFELIKTYKLDELKARYAALRSSVMSESNIAKLFTDYAGKIPLVMYEEDNRRWPLIPRTSVHTVDSILNWYRLRCLYVDAELEGLTSD